MKTYRVTLYPNVESYTTTVEAESVEEAIAAAEEEAKLNAFFTAFEKDVKEEFP